MSGEQPLVARQGPYSVQVEGGRRYFWCACGRSERQPFCDGSHKGTGFTPVVYTAERSEWLWFCGCKRSATPPLCDGSHRRMD